MTRRCADTPPVDAVARSEQCGAVRAELQGKLDPAATLAAERMEDTLTDAVFSAVRYLPRRHLLAPLLAAALPGAQFSAADLERATVTLWPRLPVSLLPGRQVEPDVLVEAGDHLVAFEAKYHSGFGRYEVEGRGTLQQLTVQGCALAERAAARGAGATVVALTTAAAEPADVGRAREELGELRASGGTSGEPQVRWLPWRAVADLLRGLRDLAVHERALRDDTVDLMERRGVATVFSGFDVTDYRQVADAQRVAAERLYPAISTFLQELTARLEDDGIEWGWPQKGLWTAGGLGWQRPQDWARDHVAAAYWPAAWPQRTLRKSERIALYVLFDFVRPGVEVGYVQEPPTWATAQRSWSPHHADLADQLTALDDPSWTLLVDAGDWTGPAVEVPAREVSAALLGGLSAYSHLRLARRFTVEDAGAPDVVRDAVRQVRRAVEACPAFAAMTVASGQLAATAGSPSTAAEQG